MAEYICTEKCFHDGSLYRRGDILKGGEPPKDKAGNIRHFVETGSPIASAAKDAPKGQPNDVKNAVEKKAADEAEAAAKGPTNKQLMNQLMALGVEFKPNMNKAQLLELLEGAQKKEEQ